MVIDVKPDSLFIEPDSINHNYVDSNLLKTFFIEFPQLKKQSDKVIKFYEKRNFQYAWFENSGLNEQGRLFINLIKNHNHEGVYDSIPYDSLMNNWYTQFIDTTVFTDSIAPHFEVMLTAQFFQYAQRIWGGIPEEQTKDLEWYIKRKRLPYVALLDSILADPNFFARNKPVYKQYDLLKNYLQQYHDLEAHSKWDSIPFNKKIYKLDDEDSILIAVRKRLFLFGDLTLADTLNINFDSTLQAAVILFQQRYGYQANGTIGKQTMNALNTPLQKRITQLVLNMERCRWVPRQPEGDYIAVNIPEFIMHVYEKDSLVWNCNVVVGSNANQTVIFNGDIKYVVLSPYWNIPSSIIGKEILPACKKNSSYIASHNMEVVDTKGNAIDVHQISWNQYTGKNFPYIIRQKPGKNNSLGLAKFLFPNEYSIYLHDTPAKSLFNESKRNFSHGCIRVNEPEKLADFLLRNDAQWDLAKIKSAMNGGKEIYITLNQPVQVFIGYFTAFVDSRGKLNFREDVYGHDGRLAATIFKK